MKLRQKSKRDQALDAAASVAKTWSEWRLGEKVSKTATKASGKAAKSASKASAKAKKKASKPAAFRRKPVKIAGVIALVGAAGAAIAKKLSGGKAEPLYTPPGPPADMVPPPPSPVEDLAQDAPADDKPAVPGEPAVGASILVPEQDPSLVVVEDVVDEPAVNEPIGSEKAATEDRPSSSDAATDPEDRGTAGERTAGDADDRPV